MDESVTGSAFSCIVAEAATSGAEQKLRTVAVALLLMLVALVVVTASTLTPWPFPTAVLLLASLAGIGSYLATSLGFASMAVALVPAVLAFTVKSIAETLDEIGAARRAGRPRRTPVESEQPDSSKLAA